MGGRLTSIEACWFRSADRRARLSPEAIDLTSSWLATVGTFFWAQDTTTSSSAVRETTGWMAGRGTTGCSEDRGVIASRAGRAMTLSAVDPATTRWTVAAVATGT